MSTMTRQEAEKRVARGAAFLDEKLPGWWEKIDLERLDISSGCNCVLGQLDGDYGMEYRTAHNFGFYEKSLGRSGKGPKYLVLTAFWRSLILSRRQQSEQRASAPASDVLRGAVPDLKQTVTTMG